MRASNTARARCRRTARGGWRKLALKTRRRILRALRATGNYELSLDHGVLPRPSRRLLGHDVGGGATNSFSTGGWRARRGCVIARRRLTKADHTEDDCCGDECRDEEPTSYHSLRQRHRGGQRVKKTG